MGEILEELKKFDKESEEEIRKLRNQEDQIKNYMAAKMEALT